jgi:hypothetical protein
MTSRGMGKNFEYSGHGMNGGVPSKNINTGVR